MYHFFFEIHMYNFHFSILPPINYELSIYSYFLITWLNNSDREITVFVKPVQNILFLE
jgi:hypothetical protein